MTAAARTVAVLWLGLAPTARPAVAAPAGLRAVMARDQLFFAAGAPEPLLLALVVQRTRKAAGSTTIEFKAVLARDGRWQAPFWARIALARWPGDGMEAALRGWRIGDRGKRLRVRWRAGLDWLRLRVRSAGGGFELRGKGLRAVGQGVDPHGAVRWRAGAGTLVAAGRRYRGHLVHERLVGRTVAWPRYGRFEMWLVGTADGRLLLGRLGLERGAGRALVIAASGKAGFSTFGVRVEASRPDRPSGFRLPVRWRINGPVSTRMLRAGGSIGRGRSPGGGPAVYAISAARAGQPGTTALVFHLAD